MSNQLIISPSLFQAFDVNTSMKMRDVSPPENIPPQFQWVIFDKHLLTVTVQWLWCLCGVLKTLMWSPPLHLQLKLHFPSFTPGGWKYEDNPNREPDSAEVSPPPPLTAPPTEPPVQAKMKKGWVRRFLSWFRKTFCCCCLKTWTETIPVLLLLSILLMH